MFEGLTLAGILVPLSITAYMYFGYNFYHGCINEIDTKGTERQKEALAHPAGRTLLFVLAIFWIFVVIAGYAMAVFGKNENGN